jgi:hypothetical protein
VSFTQRTPSTQPQNDHRQALKQPKAFNMKLLNFLTPVTLLTGISAAPADITAELVSRDTSPFGQVAANGEWVVPVWHFSNTNQSSCDNTDSDWYKINETPHIAIADITWIIERIATTPGYWTVPRYPTTTVRVALNNTAALFLNGIDNENP